MLRSSSDVWRSSVFQTSDKLVENLCVRTREQNNGNIVVRACHRPSDQGEQVKKVIFKPLEKVSRL